jgi:hypothetical protein
MAAKDVVQVIENSGLPEDYAKDRLERLLQESGFDPKNSGIDEIREVLANLLQDLILETEEGH